MKYIFVCNTIFILISYNFIFNISLVVKNIVTKIQVTEVSSLILIIDQI